jgi:hypothetical protein
MKSTFQLEELKHQAIALIKTAGFDVRSDVDVVLDEALPYMGYTTDIGGKPKIVVAEFAVKSGAALNLLVHELSHVYRSQTGHPSHDYRLLTAMAGWVTQGKILKPYQEKILQGILNHLQDLYADDISFAVFEKNKPQPNLNEFFLSWIQKPSTAKDPEQKAWENADAMLGASFAQANLERHKVPDTDKKVANAVKDFLAHVDKPLADKYAFFETFMVHLPEEVTPKEFESLLIKYLSEFLKLTKLR